MTQIRFEKKKKKLWKREKTRPCTVTVRAVFKGRTTEIFVPDGHGNIYTKKHIFFQREECTNMVYSRFKISKHGPSNVTLCIHCSLNIFNDLEFYSPLLTCTIIIIIVINIIISLWNLISIIQSVRKAQAFKVKNENVMKHNLNSLCVF